VVNCEILLRRKRMEGMWGLYMLEYPTDMWLRAITPLDEAADEEAKRNTGHRGWERGKTVRFVSLV
jgi:hypothetical protein